MSSGDTVSVSQRDQPPPTGALLPELDVLHGWAKERRNAVFEYSACSVHKMLSTSKGRVIRLLVTAIGVVWMLRAVPFFSYQWNRHGILVRGWWNDNVSSSPPCFTMTSEGHGLSNAVYDSNSFSSQSIRLNDTVKTQSAPNKPMRPQPVQETALAIVSPPGAKNTIRKSRMSLMGLDEPIRPREQIRHRCCRLNIVENIGHLLTDTLYEAMDCAGIIALQNADGNNHIISQFNSTIMMALGKVVRPVDECNALYSLPTGQEYSHRGKRVCAFTYTCRKEYMRHKYRPIALSKDLRRAQSQLLSSCGITSGPHFDSFGKANETKRQPSSRVLIIRRTKSRVLRNADQILHVCLSLGLDCEVFEADSLASSAGGMSDICTILHRLRDALVIGVQGAELIYTYYLGSRHLLARPSKEHYEHPIQRAVKHEAKGWQEVFYPEFAFPFGVQVTYMEGNIVEETLGSYDSLQQCAANPVFCADLILDADKVAKYLRQKLSDGELKDSQGNVTHRRYKLPSTENANFDWVRQSNSSTYVPAPLEQSILENLKRWGWDTMGNHPGCAMWTDPTHLLYSDSQLLLSELKVYHQRIDEFPQVEEDIRHHLFRSGKSGSPHDICKQLRLDPGGLNALFPSGQLSRTDSGFVEPLTTPMRHPMFCMDPKTYVFDMHYMVHDFEAMCRKLHSNSQTILIDMGASLSFHTHTNPIVFLLDLYRRFGFKFDHIYAFEERFHQPSTVFVGNSSVPTEYMPSYHWINVGVTHEKGHVLNPLDSILRNFKEEDFVAIKLDIDMPEIEFELISQLIKDDSLSKLVDCIYFEHHVHMAEIAPWWGFSMNGTLSDTFEIFFSLRSKGIAAHFWV